MKTLTETELNESIAKLKENGMRSHIPFLKCETSEDFFHVLRILFVMLDSKFQKATTPESKAAFFDLLAETKQGFALRFISATDVENNGEEFFDLEVCHDRFVGGIDFKAEELFEKAYEIFTRNISSFSPQNVLLFLKQNEIKDYDYFYKKNLL